MDLRMRWRWVSTAVIDCKSSMGLLNVLRKSRRVGVAYSSSVQANASSMLIKTGVAVDENPVRAIRALSLLVMVLVAVAFK